MTGECGCRVPRDESCPCFFQGKQEGFHRGVKFVETAPATYTVTERQAVERERVAFQDGARWRASTPAEFNLYALDTAAAERATLRYPLPKVRRLRKWIRRNGETLRWNPDRPLTGFVNTIGAWEGQMSGGEWAPVGDPTRWCVDLAEVTALADLKANPWEEVDA